MRRSLATPRERRPATSSRRSGPWEAPAGDHLLREIDAGTRHWPCDREGCWIPGPQKPITPCLRLPSALRLRALEAALEVSLATSVAVDAMDAVCQRPAMDAVSRTPAMSARTSGVDLVRRAATGWARRARRPADRAADERAHRRRAPAARRPRARARLWAPMLAPARRPSLGSGALWEKWCCLHIQATTYRRTCSPS